MAVGGRTVRAQPFESREIERRGVRELRGRGVADARKNGLDAAGKLDVPFLQHLFHRQPLHVRLRTAERARNDREFTRRGVARDRPFGNVGERPNHDVPFILAQKLRRHRLEPAAEKHVEEQRLHDIVAMMTQGDLGDAVFRRIPVQGAAAQARAQPADGLAGRDNALDHRIGVLFDDMEPNAQLGQITRQDIGRKPGLLLVQIDGDQLEADGRAALKAQQDVEQCVRVLAARQAHHDAIAGGDHAEIADRLAHQPAQLRLQLLEIVRMARRVRGHGASRYLASKYRR